MPTPPADIAPAGRQLDQWLAASTPSPTTPSLSGPSAASRVSAAAEGALTPSAAARGTDPNWWVNVRVSPSEGVSVNPPRTGSAPVTGASESGPGFRQVGGDSAAPSGVRGIADAPPAPLASAPIQQNRATAPIGRPEPVKIGEVGTIDWQGQQVSAALGQWVVGLSGLPAGGDQLAAARTRLAGVLPAGVQVAEQATAYGDFVLTGPATLRPEAVTGALIGTPGVRYATPRVMADTSKLPNDPLFINQFGLNNRGDLSVNDGTTITNAVSDADIDAPQAWNLTTGSPNVVVAVIDTGVDYNHPDLAPNMWVNPGESGALATNGIDDDADGYIDDYRGVRLLQR